MCASTDKLNGVVCHVVDQYPIRLNMAVPSAGLIARQLVGPGGSGGFAMLGYMIDDSIDLV